jgi:DNA-binding beta-propeller fold protein YncE
MGAVWFEVTRGRLASQRLDIDGGLTLGRAEEGPRTLGDDPELSRRHARFQLSADGEHVIAEDLGSANGTLVNGQPIAQPAVLGVGDSVEIGTTTLVVRSDREAPLVGVGYGATKVSQSPPPVPDALAPAPQAAASSAAPAAPGARSSAPGAPPSPPVAPAVPSVPRLPEGRPPASGGRDRRLPILALLLVLALAGLGVALATRSSTSTTTSASDGPYDGTAYVVSNTAAPGGNSVLALRYLHGSLTPVRIHEYLTGGTGGAAGKMLGNDGDGQVAVNAAHTVLYAVNQGSDTIAAFHINSDQTLTPVQGSPFPSGGQAPISIGIHGSTAVVVNKAVDDVRNITAPPTIVTFKINGDGSLTQSGSFTGAPHSSPGQALLDPTGKVLVVPDLFAGDILGLAQGSNGVFHQVSRVSITQAEATNGQNKVSTALPAMKLPPGVSPPKLPTLPPGTPPAFTVQGFAFDPVHPFVYGGIALKGELLVLGYSPTGALNLVNTVPIPHGAGVCWAAITPDGHFLYLSLTFSNTIAVFDISTPSQPRFVEDFPLKGLGGSFNVSLDPSGTHAFVVSIRNGAVPPSAAVLHSLQIGADGRLSEPTPPAALPVSYNALKDDTGMPGFTSPYGVAVLARH